MPLCRPGAVSLCGGLSTLLRQLYVAQFSRLSLGLCPLQRSSVVIPEYVSEAHLSCTGVRHRSSQLHQHGCSQYCELLIMPVSSLRLEMHQLPNDFPNLALVKSNGKGVCSLHFFCLIRQGLAGVSVVVA